MMDAITQGRNDLMADAEIQALINRLMLLPALMELPNQTQVAAAIGVGYKNWHHTLRTGDLSFNTAKAIVRALPGMDLDWLTFGVESGLATHIFLRVRQLADQPAAAARPSKPARASPKSRSRPRRRPT
jgi:hypothetical protein